jgi:hypothetical protein
LHGLLINASEQSLTEPPFRARARAQQGQHTAVDLNIQLFICNACGSDRGISACLRPGNSLEGRIRIPSKSALRFTSLEVMFQGWWTGAIAGVAPGGLNASPGLQSVRLLAYRMNSTETVPYPIAFHDTVSVKARNLVCLLL